MVTDFGGLEFFDGLLLLVEVAGEFDFGFDGAGLVAAGGAGDGGRRNPPLMEPPPRVDSLDARSGGSQSEIRR